MIPLTDRVNPGESADFEKRAAVGAAVASTEVFSLPKPLGPAATQMALAWPKLPPHVRDATAMLVDACGGNGRANGLPGALSQAPAVFSTSTEG
jgi:hypothetical protein